MLTNRDYVLEVVSPAQDEGRGPADTRPYLTYQPCQQEFDNQVDHCDGEGEGVALHRHSTGRWQGSDGRHMSECVCRTHCENPFVVEGEADGERVVEADQRYSLQSSQQQGHCAFQYYIAQNSAKFSFI